MAKIQMLKQSVEREMEENLQHQSCCENNDSAEGGTLGDSRRCCSTGGIGRGRATALRRRRGGSRRRDTADGPARLGAVDGGKGDGRNARRAEMADAGANHGLCGAVSTGHAGDDGGGLGGARGHGGLAGRCGLVDKGGEDADLHALLAYPLVVEVVEGAAQAVPPARCAADGEGLVLADGEATRVDGTCLWRAVELELVVRNDAAGAVPAICEHAVDESEVEGAIGILGSRCQFMCIASWIGGVHTATATSSRRARVETGTYPIVKLPLGLSSQPSGGGASGAMPTSTAWAWHVAARERAAARTEAVRIVYLPSGAEWRRTCVGSVCSVQGWGLRCSSKNGGPGAMQA